MTPLVQVSSDPDTMQRYGSDLDAALDGPPARAAAAAVEVLRAVASRTVQPRAQSHGDVGFQVTRGLLGVSM
jgi:hypothetical protein